MSDTTFFHDYVPPSKRPKPPTPPPEPKETNPWLISAPTPNGDPAASPEPAPSQAEKNNPWLISAPTPNLAPAPAAQEAPAPAPAPPQFIPGLVYAAFPVRI